MAIATYSGAHLGFGVTYDDADLARAETPLDPRFAAAWRDRFTTRIAGGVLFCPSTTTAEKIGAGTGPSLLITTDKSPLPAGVMGNWDWDGVTAREAAPFMTLTGADEIEAVAVYWRGFPVLQLAVVNPPESRPSMPTQLLGMLYTPAQTFSSLLVVPRGLEDPWAQRFQEVMDGFFLLPIEREGRARTGHQHVRSLHLSFKDLEGLAAR
ncbi:MAG TPA: hypothetical protein VMH50_08285 [Thermoleophilia bacterium]|nr:hypothetical protein [Thermoleophilia bacterium]